MSDVTQYCTFRLGGSWFGIDVAMVREVLRSQQLTPVPRAAPQVAGLMNLRGQIVTAIDLRRRLQLPPRPDDEEPVNVVVRADGGDLSLLVDAIDDVVTVDTSTFEPPPPTVRGVARDLVVGTHKLDELLHVLDVERVVRLEAAS